MKILEKLSHRVEEAQALCDAGKMYDCVPITNPYIKRDMKILDVWREHFKTAVNVPFIVEETERMGHDYVLRDNLILWKQKYI